MPSSRVAAVDTKLLIGEAIGIPHHRAALDHFRNQFRFVLAVCPVTIAELNASVELGDVNTQRMAGRVLEDLDDSDYIRPVLTDTEEQVVEIHARRILERGVLPGGNLQDARLLIEAAYSDSVCILTTRDPLLDAASDSLKLALVECGMIPMAILSPSQIVAWINRIANPA